MLALALASPIDTYSDRLFWVHMVQHVLLMLVAAPLFVLSRPWTRLWRVLPLGLRRPLARGLVQSPTAAPLRSVARLAGSPAGALALFTVVLLGWHVPALFEATLESEAIHIVEHVLFFAVALLFFKHLIPSPPLHAPLGEGGARALRRRGHDRELGARRRARGRAQPAVLPLRATSPRARAASARSPTSSWPRA